jgi:hypothetical protein
MTTSSPDPHPVHTASAARVRHDLPALPTTAAGRLSLALVAAFSALFAWVMLLDPVVGALVGQDPTPLHGSWLPALFMVLLVDAAAVAGLVARHRGERALLAQVVCWGSLVLAVLWTGIIGTSFLTGR